MFSCSYFTSETRFLSLADAHQEHQKPMGSTTAALSPHRIRTGLLISKPVTNLDLKHDELIKK